MLLRLALLSALISVCLAMSSMSMIAETMYKPCIVHKIRCPDDGSMDLDKFASTVRTMMLSKPPRECRCNLERETCVRSCYYAYLVKMYLASAEAGKTSASEIAAAKSSMLTLLRTKYRPCIIEGKHCGHSFSLHSIRSSVKDYISSSSLPSECDCDVQRETCIRRCYYSYLKRTLEASAAK